MARTAITLQGGGNARDARASGGELAAKHPPGLYRDPFAGIVGHGCACRPDLLMSQRPWSPIAPGRSLVTGWIDDGESFAGMRPRGTSDWQMIATVAGAGCFRQRGGDLIARAGDLILLRAGAPHDYRTLPKAQRWRYLWCHFHPRDDWLDLLAWPETANRIMRVRLDDPACRRRVLARLREVDAHAKGTHARADRFAANALETALLLIDATVGRAASGLDPRVVEAMQRLASDLARPLAFAEIARALELSASRLAHLFRAGTGMSPGQYREQQRLRRAAELLADGGLRVGAVAAAVGFSDPFYFSQRFRRFAGVAPLHYRRGGPAAQKR